MTVLELIAELQKMNPVAIVEVDYDGPDGSRRLTRALEVVHDDWTSALLVGDGTYESECDENEEEDESQP